MPVSYIQWLSVKLDVLLKFLYDAYKTFIWNATSSKYALRSLRIIKYKLLLAWNTNNKKNTDIIEILIVTRNCGD